MQKDIIYKFQGSDEVYASHDATPVGRPAHARVDIQRMEVALRKPSIAMPLGLSREEKRAFILAHANLD